jgi:predicted RNA-binding Zn-ribbon protein involved in translation (DUF1610 family)
MSETALKCPQCGGPLQPGRFARIAVCPHCGSTIALDEQTVQAERFRTAFRAWNSPEAYGITEWLTVEGMRWAVGDKIAAGHVSDVYFAQRARWPTECILVKVLRSESDHHRFQNGWRTLVQLNRSLARGAETFSKLTPQPVFYGRAESGLLAGTRVMAFRWAGGFNHSLEGVMRAYPAGIPPRSSIWLWRRVLEILSFIHASGFVHGAVLPPHLMVEDGEHGVRLVGYGCSGEAGEPLRHASPRDTGYYPEIAPGKLRLSPELDIVMSARLVAALLGGNPATGEFPDAVPPPLSALIADAARWRPGAGADSAWALRERLGQLAKDVYGPPRFCPIVMRGKEE